MEMPKVEILVASRDDYCVGSGELGEMVRTLDWSTTPLGPVQGWPQSLRTAVSVIFAAQHPMYLTWGSEYIQFFNDAFCSLLGAKGPPRTLGKGAAETLGSTWNQIGPLFHQVMSSGETVEMSGSPLNCEDSRSVDESEISHRYSPLLDDSGNVGGVLLSCGSVGGTSIDPLRNNPEPSRPHIELGQFNEQLRLLTRAVQRVTSDCELEEFFQIVRTAARTLLAADGVTIVLREGGFCHYVDEEAIGPLWKGKRFPLDDGISGWVMKHNTSAIIEDISLDPRIPLALYRPTFVKSLAMFPLSLGEPLGAIGYYWARSHAPTPQEQQLMALLAELTARSIDSVRAYAELAHRVLAQDRAEAALLDSESRSRAMMDNSPAFVFMKDLGGRYLDVNRRFAEALGMSVAEIVGRTDEEIFPKREAEVFRSNDLHVIRTGTASQFEEVASCIDGKRVSIVSKFALLDRAGEPYAVCGISVDISERKRTETALWYSNQSLQSIFDAAPVAVLGFDLTGRITHWSAGAQGMFGWTEEETLGQTCPSIPHEQFSDFHAMIGRVARGSLESLVQIRQKKNGEQIRAKLSSAPLRDSNGKIYGVMVILEDITEKIRADDALHENKMRLRQLSRQLLAAQEQERRRIARELHDQLGQDLVVLQINLRMVGELPGAESVTDALEESIVMVEALHEQVRNLSLDLHPLLLDDLGLVPALRWHVSRLDQSCGCQIRFSGGDWIGRFPAELETACFRVAQEALTNILRHAQGSKVSVDLTRTPLELTLKITDDGVGFDTQAVRRAATEGRSLGLLSMEERVSDMGGDLSIESVPNRGTVICAVFPIIYPSSTLTESPDTGVTPV